MNLDTDTALAQAIWPIARLAEGIEALARHAGLRPCGRITQPPGDRVMSGDADETSRWVSWAASRLGIEAEPVQCAVPEVESMIVGAAPALFCLRASDGPGFVLVVRARGRRLRLLGPDLRLRHCRADALRAAMCAAHERPLLPEIDRLLELAAVPARRRAAAGCALLRQRLAADRIDGAWLLRPAVGSSLVRQLRAAGVHTRLLGLLLAFGAAYVLEIWSWALIGGAALDGRLDWGWLAAWALLLMTLVPLRVVGGWLQGSLSMHAGRVIKQRVIAGALALDPDTMRRHGAGQLLGRVMESQALESLALNGGLAVIVALLELACAVWVLAHGAAPVAHPVLMLGWLVVVGALGRWYAARLRRWTGQRLDMTHALIERMVGHRTVLAQSSPSRRRQEDDTRMHGYLSSGAALDRIVVPLGALAAGGWIPLGLCGLAPAFVAGGSGATALAISLGGVLLGARAFAAIGGGAAALSGAALAWTQVAPVLRAAAQERITGPFLPDVTERIDEDASGGAGPSPRLVDISDLVYRHREQQQPVLAGTDLSIDRGERILLEGPSGGGKSTLAAIIAGLRAPERGVLLMAGLDRHTLGIGWHEMATAAPQFHENHVLGGSLAFNLLMGRGWPATEADLRDARDLCDALGLGPLIARMPSGLMQRVGETGWQLSHGECSRIFLARALLQRAPLTVLDESFAALDPETLDTCLQAAVDEAQTLLVVAHP